MMLRGVVSNTEVKLKRQNFNPLTSVTPIFITENGKRYAMTINNENQQQDNNKIENSIEKNWILQLAPTTVTLIPSDQAGQMIVPQGNYADIIRYREIQLELQETQNKLKIDELIRLDLIRNIGHSIEIPCSRIFALITVLYEVEQDTERKHYLKTIVNCAERLLDYSHHVLEFLRKNAALTAITLEKFNIKELVNKTITKAKPASISKGLNLSCNFQYDIAEHIIGDHSRLQAVLDQLVGNAIKFTKEGNVIVTVGLFPLLTETKNTRNKILQFIVHDTGIGIAEGTQQDMHKELDDANTIAKYNKGLGLGLTFVKQLINEMDGKITITSKEGKSTTITCQVPVKLLAN
ncbi:sensor histidine kinase [Rickettsia endosymbiont of Oedothorax gibbosus]|uniref:sensor histidine kinase n=2 Tax=Rickettsieae TaxID=33988 RepID=UPI0020242BAA|nr:ATP-binding protein [Rickettsia endosymbiont of Oedothorax gibbosus]